MVKSDSRRRRAEEVGEQQQQQPQQIESKSGESAPLGASTSSASSISGSASGAISTGRMVISLPTNKSRSRDSNNNATIADDDDNNENSLRSSSHDSIRSVRSAILSQRPLLTQQPSLEEDTSDARCLHFSCLNPLVPLRRMVRSIKNRRSGERSRRSEPPQHGFRKLTDDAESKIVSQRVQRLIHVRSIHRTDSNTGSISSISSMEYRSLSVKDSDDGCSSDDMDDDSMNYIRGAYSADGLSTLYEVDEEDLTEASSCISGSKQQKKQKKKEEKEEANKTEKLARYLKYDDQDDYDYASISQAISSGGSSVDEEPYIWDSLWEMYPSMPNDPCDPHNPSPRTLRQRQQRQRQRQLEMDKHRASPNDMTTATCPTDSDNSLSGGEEQARHPRDIEGNGDGNLLVAEVDNDAI